MFSPDDARIATGSAAGLVNIWGTETLSLQARLAGHDDYVSTLDWSARDEQLVSGGGDGLVQVWGDRHVAARFQARAERAAALPRVEARVDSLFAEVGDAARVRERIDADTSLGEPDRKLARQLVLRALLERELPR